MCLPYSYPRSRWLLPLKKDYAPVYVWRSTFAHRFAQIYHIEVSEDEIAFIAFYIGSYLGRTDKQRAGNTRALCSYLSATICCARRLIHEINVAFANQIIIKGSSAPEPVPQPSPEMRPLSL